MLEVGTKAPEFSLPDQNKSDSLFLSQGYDERLHQTGL